MKIEENKFNGNSAFSGIIFKFIGIDFMES